MAKHMDWQIYPLYQSGNNCLGINVYIPIKQKRKLEQATEKDDEEENYEEEEYEKEEEEKDASMRKNNYQKIQRSYKIIFIDSL